MFALLLYSTNTKAQIRQDLYWLRYYIQLKINNKYSWHSEIEDRRFFSNNTQQHLIMHSRFYYKFAKSTDLAIGFTYSLQSPQIPSVGAGLIVPELRPNQEMNWSHPLLKNWLLQQRLRVEERFMRNNNGKVLEDGYKFDLRFRYRLQLNYVVNSLNTENTTTLKLSNETMLSTARSFDQNRLYFALEKNFSKTVSAEIGYLHLYQKSAVAHQ